MTLTLLVDAYREEEVEGETRVVLGFHPAVAPIKAGVFPLVKKDGMPELATALYHDLKRRFPVFYDDSGAIGRRYRRMDEAGTPFGITVDGETVGAAHRHRAPPGLDAAGAGRPGPGGGLRGGAAWRPGGSDRCEVTTMRLVRLRSHGRRMAGEVPAEFLDGVAEIVVSPRTVPHPDAAGSSRWASASPSRRRTAAVPRGSRAGSCSITARSPRWPGSTPGFDWREEAWETLTHELRHHLEWRARAPDLEELDWAVEQNYARQDGEAFDPALLSWPARPPATTCWRVEDDVFLDRSCGPVPASRSVCAGRGREYRGDRPPDSHAAGLPRRSRASPTRRRASWCWCFGGSPESCACSGPCGRYHAAVRAAEATLSSGTRRRARD